MRKFVGVIAFAAGAAVGGAASWLYAKKKYEQIAQEEIDSVKEVFSRTEDNLTCKDYNELGHAVSEGFKRGIGSVTVEKPDLNAYAAGINNLGYTDYSTTKETEKKIMEVEKPYVIRPDEFGELDGYSEISLTYYADEQLADDLNELVEDIIYIIGEDALNHFGEYEEDSVYIRNDALEADYEILLDQRNYSDVLKTLPPKREDL